MKTFVLVQRKNHYQLQYSNDNITSVDSSHFDINGKLYERVYGVSHNIDTYSFYSKFRRSDVIRGSNFQVDDTTVDGQAVGAFANVEDFIDAIRQVCFDLSADKRGFINYNDTSTTSVPVALLADTWTDLPNDGLGAQTLKTFSPEGVTELLDVSTGYLDFTELTNGSEAHVRTAFSVNPAINNALLEFRFLAGTGGGVFDFTTSLGRLDDGSGKYYSQTIERSMYMDGSNAIDNPWKLQIKLTSAGTFINLGSYIAISKK